MNSPVRLGVSPAAASTPTGVFSQRFEALFPRWSPGLWVCHAVQQLLTLWLAAASPALLHNPLPQRVHQSPACHESSPPGCLSPPLLPVWMNVFYLYPWLSDFREVRFSVSSGCFLFLCWCACYIKGWSLRCSPVWGNAPCCVVMLYVGEGSERECWRLLCSQSAFSHFPCYPHANRALLWLNPRWVGLCTF